MLEAWGRRDSFVSVGPLFGEDIFLFPHMSLFPLLVPSLFSRRVFIIKQMPGLLLVPGTQSREVLGPVFMVAPSEGRRAGTEGGVPVPGVP